MNAPVRLLITGAPDLDRSNPVIQDMVANAVRASGLDPDRTVIVYVGIADGPDIAQPPPGMVNHLWVAGAEVAA